MVKDFIYVGGLIKNPVLGTGGKKECCLTHCTLFSGTALKQSDNFSPLFAHLILLARMLIPATLTPM